MYWLKTQNHYSGSDNLLINPQFPRGLETLLVDKYEALSTSIAHSPEEVRLGGKPDRAYPPPLSHPVE